MECAGKNNFEARLHMHKCSFTTHKRRVAIWTRFTAESLTFVVEYLQSCCTTDSCKAYYLQPNLCSFSCWKSLRAIANATVRLCQKSLSLCSLFLSELPAKSNMIVAILLQNSHATSCSPESSYQKCHRWQS